MRILPLLCLALLSFTFRLATDEVADDGALVPTLPVVATWGELGTLPPTILADGSEVRLGIQALEGPVGSAVAIYVLTAPTTPLEPSPGGGACGPIRILVNNRYHENSMHDSQCILITERLSLFTYLVPLRERGPTLISLFGQQSSILAKTSIIAHHTDYQPWSTILWKPPLGVQALEDAMEAPGVVSAYERIGLGPGESAVAALDCRYPWASIHPTLLQEICTGAKDDIHLPVPQPADPHPLVHVEATSTGVLLGMPFEFMNAHSGGFGSMACDMILARWWKNGVPWLPPGILEARQSSVGAMRNDVRSDTIRLNLDLTITADQWPNDRIEVQFLITPGGYSIISHYCESTQLTFTSLTIQDEEVLPSPGIMLSPRITLLPQ